MKRCPECRRDYYDETLLYCLDDGTALLDGPSSVNEPRTEILGPSSGARNEAPTDVRLADGTSVRSRGPQNSSSAEFIVGRIKSNKALTALVFAIIAVAGIAAVYGAYSFFGGDRRTASPAVMRVTRLTTSGKVRRAAISGDGRYAAHVVEESAGQGLWVRQIATTSDIKIIPASGTQYVGLAFSADGNYVYYARREGTGARATVFQVPTLGGASKKIADGSDSSITVSPDGRQIAFYRIDYQNGVASLVAANIDGSGERVIVQRSGNSGFDSGIAWSPDGKVIACAGYNGPNAEAVNLVAVSVEDGTTRDISAKRYGSINSISWLRDGSGLIISAADNSSGYFFQIWQVPLTGEARRITTDLNSYSDMSLTADSKTALTIQSDWTSNLWLAPNGDAAKAKKITAGKYDGGVGVAWTPDGRIVASNRDWKITILNADGTDQRLLTPDEHNNRWASVSRDGRYILFESWRQSAADGSVWRMDLDGGNPVALTTSGWASGPRSSPDGRWVVYESSINGKPNIWKTPIDGGEQTRLSDIVADEPAVSPDGKLVACFYYPDGQPIKIAVIPFDGGPPVHFFDVNKSVRDKTPGWTPDGKAVMYILNEGGVSNLFAQPLAGGPPKQITDFKDGRIFAFDWSPDNKQLLLSRGDITYDAVLISGF